MLFVIVQILWKIKFAYLESMTKSLGSNWSPKGCYLEPTQVSRKVAVCRPTLGCFLCSTLFKCSESLRWSLKGQRASFTDHAKVVRLSMVPSFQTLAFSHLVMRKNDIVKTQELHLTSNVIPKANFSVLCLLLKHVFQWMKSYSYNPDIVSLVTSDFTQWDMY